MISKPAGRAVPLALVVACSGGCQNLDRFDTSGDHAYCGNIVAAQFIRTTTAAGGFDRSLRLRLELNADLLATRPGALWSDDFEGPCAPQPTFDGANLLTVEELLHDSFSTLLFDDRQEHNIATWARSTCRGPMLTVVSLLKNDDVEVRLLKPPPEGTESSERAAFALFELERRSGDCGF